MRIQLLYFQGCPNAAKALRLVNEVLEKVDLKVEVEQLEIRTPLEAQKWRFLGSPTIRIDGQDVEPGSRLRSEFGLMCRTYVSGGRLAGGPSREQIITAIKSSNNTGTTKSDDRCAESANDS